jgi:hypothetical protein
MAARHWVATALASGALTLEALRNGSTAARALPLGAIFRAAAPQQPFAAPSEPAESPCEDSELLLDNLLGALLTRRKVWFDLMAELPQELLDRIERWIERS